MAVVDVRAFKRQQRKMFSKGADKGAISPSLFGLPIRRVIPVDVHALLDYSGATMLAAAGLVSANRTASAAGAALGLAGAGVSLLTDYRLSVRKWIPIEVHEAIDYLWGASAILAPFVLGYAKKSPFAAFVHIVVGASTILGSLFTDYRAVKDVHWTHMPAFRPGQIGA